MEYVGKTALVTGATGGIGAGIARGLAARGCNLVLTGRSKEKLRALAADILQEQAVDIQVVVADLRSAEAAQSVYDAVKQHQLTIDILVNNAGFGNYGSFHAIEWQREHDEMSVDIVALTKLCHMFIPGMLQRGQGTIVNVASVAGFQPLPYMASYGACKAYVVSLSQALHEEYGRQGVHVLALCPGPTETPFFAVSGSGASVFRRRRTVDDVVRTMFDALNAGKVIAVDGWRNKLIVQLNRVASRRFVVGAVARQTKPRP